MTYLLHILFGLFVAFVLLIAYVKLKIVFTPDIESAKIEIGNHLVGALLLVGCLIAIAIVIAN